MGPARVMAWSTRTGHQRNSAKEQLQKAGYMVSTAVDGFEAMQRLEETPVKDAIIISGLRSCPR